MVEPEYKESFHEACEVSINNNKYRPLLWEPRCLKILVSELKTGNNKLTTRVYTNLLRSFEGNVD